MLLRQRQLAADLRMRWCAEARQSDGERELQSDRNHILQYSRGFGFVGDANP